MCKKLLVLTKSCRARTDEPVLVSNTGMRPANERRRYNVMSSHWLHAYTEGSQIQASENCDIIGYDNSLLLSAISAPQLLSK